MSDFFKCITSISLSGNLAIIILLLLFCEFDSLPADKPSLPETLISDRVKSVQAMMGQYCEICSECKVVWVPGREEKKKKRTSGWRLGIAKQEGRMEGGMSKREVQKDVRWVRWGCLLPAVTARGNRPLIMILTPTSVFHSEVSGIPTLVPG